ncbi:MAG: hypothetical protein C0401_07270 [Anaerolinea sp.]|nr:hypothetical protein [Anaerolinea sp.]
MKQILIGTAVVIVALGVGIGGACAVSKILPDSQLQWTNQQDYFPQNNRAYPRGMMGGFSSDPRGSSNFGRGMMGGRYTNQIPAQGERITVDEAITNAEDYVANVSDNLRVMEVMEFSRNFYIVVVETDTDKAAFELLVDPYNGWVTPEFGPNMMWNLKYGHMRLTSDAAVVNTITMADAAALAQKALDVKMNGAVVQTDGIDFYGYYSFDYKLDGKVAGMLSVNGESGRVWFHNWHGTFISEKEMSE